VCYCEETAAEKSVFLSTAVQSQSTKLDPDELIKDEGEKDAQKD